MLSPGGSSLLLLLQALCFINYTAASPVNTTLHETNDLTSPSETSVAAPTPPTTVGQWFNVEQDAGLGMTFYGTWWPGEGLKVVCSNAFDPPAILFFDNYTRLKLHEAKIRRILHSNWNARVTFVDYSDTENLLAIYIDGQYKGRGWHKSYSVMKRGARPGTLPPNPLPEYVVTSGNGTDGSVDDGESQKAVVEIA